MTEKSYEELALDELEEAATHSRPRGDWGYCEYNLKRASVYAMLAVAQALKGEKE